MAPRWAAAGFHRGGVELGEQRLVGLDLVIVLLGLRKSAAASEVTQDGVAFTVEPGLYDSEAGIGIRIEDVVVIPEKDCEVLSALAPKEREEVEKTVQAESILDRLAANGE